MTLRKASAVLSLLGLVLSLSLLLTHAQAAAKSSRALSPAEMAAIRGAGMGVCDNLQCNNSNGCTNFGSAYIQWYPKYMCRWVPYGTCDNFGYGLCWYKWYYTNFMCPDSNYLSGSTGSDSTNYCGVG